MGIFVGVYGVFEEVGFSFQRRPAESDREVSGKRGGILKRMSIHLLYTESKDVRDGRVSHIQEAILLLLLAQPYCVHKVEREG